MKNSTKVIGGTLAILAIIGTGATTALAYKGDPNVKGPNYTPERHEAMTNAFATGDYNAWAELMSGKGRVSQMVTADNFARFAQAHALAQAGDLEGAKAIRAELGLGMGDGSGQGKGNGYGRGQGAGNGGGFHRVNR